MSQVAKNNPMQPLAPLTVSLLGNNVIEASAGTGKTYTITGLYLRYLLGLYEGGEPLGVERILVVTFTEAATAEIKDRVRARIITARDVLLGQATQDALVNDILNELPQEDYIKAFYLLDSAAKSIDDAAIFTIHGFCNRMLNLFAFESGTRFDSRFVMDQSDFITRAVKDFWRETLYPMDETKAREFMAAAKSPAHLLSQIQLLVSHPEYQVMPAWTMEEYANRLSLYKAEVADFKAQCVAANITSTLENAGLKGNKPPGNKKYLAALTEYLHNDEVFFSASKYGLEIYDNAELADEANYKAKHTPIQLGALGDEMASHASMQKQLQNGYVFGIYNACRNYVLARLKADKESQSVLTPDDLLHDLHQALKAPNSPLAERIVGQYPVALIDEFQDTDPIQWGIFSAIYQSEPQSALTLIGDPKQAIYGFRGADIHTYIAAKETIAESRRFTLETNYRSDSPIVQSVNALFLKNPNPFLANDTIDYLPVNAHHGQSRLEWQGHKACEFFALEGEAPLSVAAGNAKIAEHIADKIVTLLDDAKHGRALIAGNPVTTGDIAILVRSRTEAAIMKTALKKRAVQSVYLSRHSVLKTPLAKALYNLLHVLFIKPDEKRLRGLLIGPLLQQSADEVLALKDDEGRWQHWLMQFERLKQVFLSQGPMALVTVLITDFNAQHSAGDEPLDVARCLTDLRHLGEILERKSRELDGSARLIKWFAKAMTESDLDEASLRLESDDALVKIVTQHASKGLEYPVVFVPFGVSYREADDAIFNGAAGRTVDLSKTPDNLEKAQQARLGEDCRLLYVTLTRAVHYLGIGVYPVKRGRANQLGFMRSALGYLLGLDSDEWQSHLDAFCQAHADMAYHALPEEPDNLVLAENAQNHISNQALAVKAFNSKIERDWHVTSFSHLSRFGADHSQTSADIPQAAFDEHSDLDILSVAKDKNTLKTPYTFAKGAGPGSALHQILEDIPFADFNHPDKEQAVQAHISGVLSQYHLDEAWSECVATWLSAVVLMPMQGQIRLADLTPSQCLIEPEFHLPLKGLNVARLNSLIKRIYGYDAMLSFDAISGLLKGFIDLVFEWQGKYYVLDYKSNYLGDSPQDYQGDALMAAMQSHHYTLQALIYTIALHRLLQNRVPDYQPSTHLGGTFYTFLRAMPDGEGVHFHRIDDALLAECDALFAKEAL